MFYLQIGWWNGQQIWLTDRSSKFFDLLTQFKGGEWLNRSESFFNSNHNLPEFIFCCNFLLFTAILFYLQKCCSHGQQICLLTIRAVTKDHFARTQLLSVLQANECNSVGYHDGLTSGKTVKKSSINIAHQSVPLSKDHISR